MGFLDAWSFKRNTITLFHPPTSPTHAAPLDGFRALAVVWVLVFHSFVSMPFILTLSSDDWARYTAMSQSFSMRVILNGPLGVDMFFILSGCLIMTILSRELGLVMKCNKLINDPSSEALLANAHEPNTTRLSITRAVITFFIRRYFRIMPAYAVALVVGMIKGARSGVPEGDACVSYFWRNLLFIQNFFPGAEMCLVWSWSIAVEWQMYMVSPLIVWAALRWSKRVHHLLSILALVSFALYIGLKAHDLTGNPVYFASVSVEYMPFTRTFAYFFGMTIAVEIQRKKEQVEQDSTVDVAPFTNRAVLQRVLSISAVLFVSFCTSSDASQDYGWYVTQTLLARPLFVAGMASIMYDSLLPRPPGSDSYQTAVNYFLCSRALYFMAQISYSMYLFHLFLVAIYQILNPALVSGAVAFVPQWIFPVFTLLLLIITTLVSLVVYYLVEKPAINIGADLLRRH